MPENPNILLIMCDQLTARVLSCYGGQVQTPNLDRLAREGVLFTNATCPTPFCSPSRASMITGLYPHGHGMTYNVMRIDYPHAPGNQPTPEEGITAADTTLGKLLYEAGYDTHHYGKWHLSGESLPWYADTYAEHLGYGREMAIFFDGVRQRPRHEWMDWYGWAMPVKVAPEIITAVEANSEAWASAPYRDFITKMGRLRLDSSAVFDVRVAARAAKMVRRAGSKPFMITCSFNAPHDPNIVPAPWYDMYPPDKIELPANYEHREARFNTDWSSRVVELVGGEPGMREFLRIYYGSVALIDEQVGHVLEALDDSGKADDTIVVFSADHGDMAGGHGMFWKSTHSFYDEVARVPLIIRYPRLVKPGRTDVATGLTDLMPTLLDLAGQSAPENVHGGSLAPLLRGEAAAGKLPEFSFCERITPHPERRRRVHSEARGNFMVRGRGWKYVVHHDGEAFLYSLTDDPGECHNRLGDKSCRATAAELRAALEDWLTRTACPVPLRDKK